MASRMAKKLLSGVFAGILLLSASNVTAQSLDGFLDGPLDGLLDGFVDGLFVDVWVYAGVQSSSGTVKLERDPADFCMEAVGDLRDMGFQLKNMMQVRPRLSVLYFESAEDAEVQDAVALFCALIIEPKE